MSPCGNVSDVSPAGGRVLTRAGNDRAQVEPVGRTVARAAGLESGSTPLEEPDSSNAVAAATTVALSAIVGRQPGLLRPA